MGNCYTLPIEKLSPEQQLENLYNYYLKRFPEKENHLKKLKFKMQSRLKHIDLERKQKIKQIELELNENTSIFYHIV